jgi:hypothetical protein
MITLIAAALVILAILVLCKVAADPRETFVSKRAYEIHSQAVDLFAADASYTEYKSKVGGTDPVQYRDLRKRYKEGRLTPQTVETALTF